MMITIGITGGVGAGKSTVLDFLEEKYQAYVMKADEIGHLVMEPGQSCYEPVIALFGRQIIKNDKTIDRRQAWFLQVSFGLPDSTPVSFHCPSRVSYEDTFPSACWIADLRR